MNKSIAIAIGVASIAFYYLIAEGEESIEAEYDFIIVGGGTAACVLAARLSETKASVLMIEAGKSDKSYLFSRIPVGFPKLFGSEADWNYHTAPQKHMNGRELFYPRGKMVGGCTAINAMINMIGSPDDFDEWERLGNRGWNFANLQRGLKKSERFSPRNGYSGATEHRGKDGPMSAGYVPNHETMVNAFVQAHEELGVRRVDDFNTPQGPLGVSRLMMNVDDKGERSSTSSYLTREVLGRRNLKVLTGAYVTRVLLEGNKAIGVEYAFSKNGRRYTVHSKRDVIMSAGSIGSPQILMCSGVGPKEELQSLNIEVVQDLPIGRNLMDHVSFPCYQRVKEGMSMNFISTPLGAIPSIIQWLRNGTGYAAMPLAQAASFLKVTDKTVSLPDMQLEDVTAGEKGADLEILFGPVTFMNHGRTTFGFSGHFATMGNILLRPTSVGTVTIRSDNVFEKAVIDPNYLATEHDRKVAVQGMRFMTRLWKTNAMRDVTEPLKDGEQYRSIAGTTPPAISCELEKLNDEELLEYLKNRGETLYHPVGTVKMGKKDEGGCVDDRLKVHGISQLRVVDASIMPTIVGGHTAIPVVMIAEYAAELIKEDYGLL
jgi:choline dehydrogenase